MVKHVYLFDIDGTLINARGMGSRLFRQSVAEILGYEPAWGHIDFAGQTDAGLLSRALAEAHYPVAPDTHVRFFERYHGYLETSFAETPAEILPGVDSVLRRLADDPLACVALLTGNTRRGSELKLGNFFKTFAFGVFGEQHADRNELGREARRHVDAAFGADVRLTVIGDTPNDIACARAAGATAVAVATGAFAAADLAHADRVYADLTEWDLF
jgi:phosphoglycolate phosphatase